MIGLLTGGSISLGWALVAGRKRVPRPAAGKTAFRTDALTRRIVADDASGAHVESSETACWIPNLYETTQTRCVPGCETGDSMPTRRSATSRHGKYCDAGLLASTKVSNVNRTRRGTRTQRPSGREKTRGRTRSESAR